MPANPTGIPFSDGWLASFLQRRVRIVRQQRNVLFADVLIAFVFAAGFSDASLVIDQRRDAFPGEALRQLQVSRLLSRAVDEDHRRMDGLAFRKYDRPG